MQPSDTALGAMGQAPAIRRVPVDRPWLWLQKGWRDLTQAPSASLGFGVAILIASFGLLGLLSAGGMLFYLALPLLAGFMLLGPVMALGFYEISRDLEQGRRPALARVLTSWRANPEQIAYMGLLLALFLLGWVRIATLLFALFFEGVATPDLPRLVDMLLFSDVSVPFLATGTVIGGALAALVFALSVVALPMLLDRRCSMFEAVGTSLAVARANPRPLALWAALILAFTLFGMLPFLLGLAVTLPLIGHASWHAYRDLVG